MNNNGLEKRLFSRKLIRAKVVFEDEFGEGLIYLYAEDISLGGLFLSSDIPIRVGSYVFLSFRLPNSSMEIRATGQVVRTTRPKKAAGVDDKGGLGVRFVGLSMEAVKAIQEYVS